MFAVTDYRTSGLTLDQLRGGKRDVNAEQQFQEFDQPAEPLFEDTTGGKYWVGVVAVGETILRPEEYQATRRLRAAVYIDEMGFLDEAHREDDGGESDADDARSIHFGIVEHPGDETEENIARGTLRLIFKQSESTLLPAEKYFPEAFEKSPAPLRSVEASRYIARHEDTMQQRLIFLAEIRCMVLQAIEMGIPNIYAIIEEPFARNMRLNRLPFDRISEPKMIEDYNSVNFAIRLDPNEVLEAAKRNEKAQALLLELIRKTSDGLGIGYYNNSFEERVAA